MSCELDALDRRIVVATQAGLPLEPEPYAAVARAVGAAPEEVLRRLERMLAAGAIRRIGAVPNHYALGYTANGMSVWDVEDARVDELGARVGALEFVSHCYRRPRVPPRWRYNLFAMVHGRDREEVEWKVGKIAELLGEACRAHEVLYSRRILKKAGVRLKGGDEATR
ncbi:MAG TPA: AsnC family transcriptional regulator [Burkholderiales bacterium]|nr:AsnC family transcriptional regulator [Burkholderiales bacterium]